MRHNSDPQRSRRGFTLVELMIVIVIIGIMLSLILAAAMGGVRRAEERATQSLITKLEQAMTERLEALLSQRADPTAVHVDFARIYYSAQGTAPFVEGPQRAQVIATYDMIKSEIPDVFWIQNIAGPVKYPINFAAQPLGSTGTPTDYTLPLGTLATGPGTGIFGAAYTAAAGIYKNLGYLPAGFDGVDNNGNGFIDEDLEGINASNQTQVAANLAAHKHKTARSEMLYALLVEGQGPLGSAFDRDDFSTREVQDTDHDGLPEFVDAWGEPLQFYRWPIFFDSDLQKGFPDPTKISADMISGFIPGPYNNVFEARQQDTLDPNQQLIAPSWWSSTSNFGPASGFGSSGVLSGGGVTFQVFFHSLVEPLARGGGGPTSPQTFWDRGVTTSTPNYIQRRAYYSKFLIVSAGPDRTLGIAQVGPGNPTSTDILMIENEAGQVDLNRTADVFQAPLSAAPATDLNEVGLDDITNHNLQTTGGGVQ